MVRAEVQMLVSEVSALHGQLSTMRAGMRRLEALGPITAAMATQKLESLEQLKDLLDELKPAAGTTFTKEERAAVKFFLEGLESEGFAFDEQTGEVFGRTGRRIARAGFRQALLKVVKD